MPSDKGSRPNLETDVRDLLRTYEQKYVEANPESSAIYKQASDVLAGGNTRSVLHFTPFPMVLNSGQGCHVTSEDGREYLDFVSEYSACMLGHNDPDVAEAVRATMARGINLGGASLEEQQLATELSRRIPSMERLRFCNSGTEANIMALTVAIQHTGRRKILAFQNGYHGGVLGFGTEVLPTTLPFDFILAPYNDIAHVRDLAAAHSTALAAIILEPMQGVGGMIPASPEFLRALREIADEAKAVLIFDEVVTSRLHYNALQSYYNVYPDMTTIGKFWGGGFSFGAFGGRAEIMQAFEPGRLSHSGTFNNNAFSMTAGLLACKLITEERIAAANALGDQLRKGLNDAGRGTAAAPLLWATGHGSMSSVHFGGPLAAELMDAFFFFLLDRGIYVARRGLIALNLKHTGQHVTQMLEATKEFVQRLAQSNG